MLGKLADWGWSVVLLLIGVMTTLLTRWISMLHKHERQLAILEYDQKVRAETSTTLLRTVSEMNKLIESQRRETIERMDSMRREMREDFQTLIQLHAAKDNQGG